MLQRNGYTKIGTSGDNRNKDKWENKVSLWKHNTSSTNKIVVNFDGKTDVTLLEKACEALKIGETKTHIDDDFKSKFIKARDWCSINTKDVN